MKSNSYITTEKIFYKNDENINPHNINKLIDLLSNGDYGIIEGLNVYNILNKITIEKGTFIYRNFDIVDQQYEYKYIEVEKDFNIQIEELDFLDDFLDNTNREIEKQHRYYIILYPTFLSHDLWIKYPSYFLKNIDRKLNVFLLDKEWYDQLPDDSYIKNKIFPLCYIQTNKEFDNGIIDIITITPFDETWLPIRRIRDKEYINNIIQKGLIKTEKDVIKKINNFTINTIYSKDKHTELLNDDSVYHIEPEDWYKGRQINRKGISTNDKIFELLRQIYDKNYVTHSFTSISPNKLLYLKDIMDYIFQIENKGRYKDNSVLHHRKLLIRSESPIYEQITTTKHEFNKYWNEDRSDYHYYNKLEEKYIMKFVPLINKIYNKFLFLINNSTYIKAKYELNFSEVDFLFDKFNIKLTYKKYLDKRLEKSKVFYNKNVDFEELNNDNILKDTILLDGLYLTNEFNIDWIKYKENYSIEMDIELETKISDMLNTYTMKNYESVNSHSDNFGGSNSLYVGFGNRYNTLSEYMNDFETDRYILAFDQKREFPDCIKGNDDHLYFIDGAHQFSNDNSMLDVDLNLDLYSTSNYNPQEYINKSVIANINTEDSNNRLFIKIGGYDVLKHEYSKRLTKINLDKESVIYDFIETFLPFNYKSIDICKIQNSSDYIIYYIDENNNSVGYKYNEINNSFIKINNFYSFSNDIIKTHEETILNKSYFSDSTNMYYYNDFYDTHTYLYKQQFMDESLDHFIMGDDKKRNIHMYGHQFKICNISANWEDLLNIYDKYYDKNPLQFELKYDYLLLTIDELNDNEKVMKEMDNNYKDIWRYNINERKRR